MSTTTTNYNLVKPEGSEYPDISIINGNMDAIDAALGQSLAYRGRLTSSDDLDDIATAGYWDFINSSLPSNTPSQIATHGFVAVVPFAVAEFGMAAQYAVTYASGVPIIYTRRLYSGTWGAWYALHQESVTHTVDSDYSSSKIVFARVGKVCTVFINGLKSMTTTGNYNFCTVPSDCRPPLGTICTDFTDIHGKRFRFGYSNTKLFAYLYDGPAEVNTTLSMTWVCS